MRATLGVLAAAAVLLVPVAPLLAHHSFAAEYDAKKKVSLKGVVLKVEWTNPHMRVYIDVTDASGKVTTWNMELTSPNTVQRQGWKPKDLLPGDEVVFEGYGGKVLESRGSLARIAKAATPDKPLLVQGGPDASSAPR